MFKEGISTIRDSEVKVYELAGINYDLELKCFRDRWVRSQLNLDYYRVFTDIILRIRAQS